MKELCRIPGIRVVPSQANYFLVEITNGMTAKELTKVLLLQYNLFIKDLSTKIQINDRQFVRIAIRNDADNQKLLCSLHNVMKQPLNDNDLIYLEIRKIPQREETSLWGIFNRKSDISSADSAQWYARF